VSGRPLLLATLDGYSVEGGFDTAGGPATCFTAAGQLGQCALPGDADGLWRDYEAVLDASVPLGLDGVRITFEWARLEPRPGVIDDAAFARYRAVVQHAKALGYRVTGVIIDAAWPSWLGPEAWLLPWVEPQVLAHAHRVVAELGADVDCFVAFARPDAIVRAGFITASAPPWRSRATQDASYAHTQVERIRHALATSPDCRDRLLSSFLEVPVLADDAAMRAVLGATSAPEEVHLRSLVGGTGPTASAAGLVRRVNGQWRADARTVSDLR
jgi:hypothetical protein